MALATSLPLIDLNAVTKAYQTDAGLFMALKGIDLHINAGEFVAIWGKGLYATIGTGALGGWLSGLASRGVTNRLQGNNFFEGYSGQAALRECFENGQVNLLV